MRNKLFLRNKIDQVGGWDPSAPLPGICTSITSVGTRVLLVLVKMTMKATGVGWGSCWEKKMK